MAIISISHASPLLPPPPLILPMQIAGLQPLPGDSVSGGGGGGGEADRRRCDTCSSSSIGNESEGESAVGFGSDGQDEEVQSSYKAGPLGALHALEESLPIRRGISRFYNGRSKSFCNLAASLSPTNSCKDLAKAETPYTRKRKNLLAFSLTYQRCRPKEENNLSEFRGEGEAGIETASKRVKSFEAGFLVRQRSVSWTDCSLV